ncbi:MAG: hypothetical protein GC192_21430 [Bacteroidetes bacterium]|nr:hypothetical protein [Bacteroidota bacterium]
MYHFTNADAAVKYYWDKETIFETKQFWVLRIENAKERFEQRIIYPEIPLWQNQQKMKDLAYFTTRRYGATPEQIFFWDWEYWVGGRRCICAADLL